MGCKSLTTWGCSALFMGRVMVNLLFPNKTVMYDSSMFTLHVRTCWVYWRPCCKCATSQVCPIPSVSRSGKAVVTKEHANNVQLHVLCHSKSNEGRLACYDPELHMGAMRHRRETTLRIGKDLPHPKKSFVFQQ
eukprot:1731669-Amphidinium_carterae.1